MMDLRRAEHFLHAVEVLATIVPSFYLTVICTNLSSTFVDHPQKLLKNLCLDYVVLVIPVVLICTVISERLVWIHLFLPFAGVLLTYFNWQRVEKKGLNAGDKKAHRKESHSNRIGYVSNLRSIVNLLTVVCILAVDFPLFPEDFHKTRQYGVSLMDVGVGLYVYANGIVACEIRGVQHSIKKTFINVLPILVIGVLRFATTYATGYHVNPAEYGVHWNFFITLAVTKLLSAVLMACVAPTFTSCLYVGVGVMACHQLQLAVGVEEFVFSGAPRDNLFTANREGIVSSLGYVGLYFVSVATGFALNTTKQRRKTFFILLAGVFVLAAATVVLHEMFNISRCLANSTYITWILLIAYVMTFLTFCYEQFLNSFYDTHHAVVYTPLLFDAINYNGLVYFLIANLITGFVNLTIDTSEVEDDIALFILFIYMFVCSLLVVLLYAKNIKLKL